MHMADQTLNVEEGESSRSAAEKQEDNIPRVNTGLPMIVFGQVVKTASDDTAAEKQKDKNPQNRTSSLIKQFDQTADIVRSFRDLTKQLWELSDLVMSTNQRLKEEYERVNAETEAMLERHDKK